MERRRPLVLGRKYAGGKPVLDADGNVVGQALEMADGSWGAFDTNEKRLSPATYDKPIGVLKFFLARQETRT